MVSTSHDEQYLRQLGARVSDLRQAKGLSQRGLVDAMLAESGGRVRTSQNAISRLERGEREPGLLEAATMATVLDVTVERLVHADKSAMVAEAERVAGDYAMAQKDVMQAQMALWSAEDRVQRLSDMAGDIASRARLTGDPGVVAAVEQALSGIDYTEQGGDAQ